MNIHFRYSARAKVSNLPFCDASHTFWEFETSCAKPTPQALPNGRLLPNGRKTCPMSLCVWGRANPLLICLLFESQIESPPLERRPPMSSNSALAFLTESLPSFTIGQQASFQLQATGGTQPYTFRIASGSLPQGMGMDGYGKITGAPQQLGDTTVFIELDDAASAKATQAFDVQVAAPARRA